MNQLDNKHFYGLTPPGFVVPGSFSYTRTIKTVISRWHWLAISLIAGMVIGILYIKYSQPVYSASASFKIEDKRSELTELINVRSIYDRNNKSESERFIIQSDHVLSRALASLNSPVSFFRKQGIRNKNIYPEKPLSIDHIEIKSSQVSTITFEYYPVTADQYQLKYTDTLGETVRIYRYGEIVSTSRIRFRILKPAIHRRKDPYRFSITDPKAELKNISRKLLVSGTDGDNIISLKITGHNPHFARDILNAIMDQYLYFDKAQRSSSVIQTENYINSLLQVMSDRISSSGKKIRDFKRNNGLINITASSGALSEELSNFQAQQHQLDLQAVSLREFDKQMNDPGNIEMNYGLREIYDPLLSKLITDHNQLVTRRKYLLNIYTAEAPEIKKIEEDLLSHTTTIRNNISAELRNNSNLRLALSTRIKELYSNLKNLPYLEQQFIDLQSRFDVNQKVFNYLSEKKLEARISREAIIPGAVIIDKASVAPEPISPDPTRTMTLSCLISLSAGIMTILLTDRLDPYVRSKETVKDYSTLPIIGTIRKYNPVTTDERIPILNDPRSLFTESVRQVRSNLNFLAAGKKSKLICITSEISGEGKSFVSLNIAVSLALMHKKVILIAADMRKSELHHFFKLQNNTGLSEHLSDQASLQEVISSTPVSNLDFIASGPIPPNPSELLHSSRMEQLAADLKNDYDFIIIDSAPTGLVSDGRPLLKMADINLFILRQGISKNTFALSPGLLQTELQLANFLILINDHREKRFGYDPYKGHYESYHKELK